MNYLSIDIGASSGRLILGHLEDGKISLEEIYRFPNGPKENKEGRLIWDIDALFASILEGLKILGERKIKIESLGIDTWAVDYVLLDENGARIGDAYCYRDARGGENKDPVHASLPFEELYARTGIQYQPFNTIYQLHDDLNSGKLAKASCFLMLPDYLHYRLTGEMRQEYTNAVSTGMVNAKSHTWDPEILERLGYPKKLFKELSQPGALVGHLKKEIQEAVGFDCKVVLPATHDTGSAVLASPAPFGAPYLASGTWSLLGVEEKVPHTDEKSMALNYSNEGSTEFAYRYQKNIMGLWIIQQIRHELKDAYSFPEIVKMAEENPTAKCFDVNEEIFLAPKSMIEAVKSRVGDLPLGELFYSVYNSLALSYKKAVEELEGLTGHKFGSLTLLGGGTKNALLNRLSEQALGIPLSLGPTEASAEGNLLVQAIASGEVKDAIEAKRIIQNS